MGTVYLNAHFKGKIEDKIIVFVNAKMKESGPGKEIKALKTQITRKLRALVQKAYPKKDMEVLAKYKLTSEITEFGFCLSGKDNIQTPPWRGDKVEISFKTPMVTKYTGTNHDGLLINLIEKNKELSDLCISAFKIQMDINCEETEVVEAYMARVNKQRTVGRLLKAHPEMKKFIPKESLPKAKPAPERADKIIDQFEAA